MSRSLKKAEKHLRISFISEKEVKVMSEKKYFEAFGKPFPVSDVSWRLQNTNKEKTMGVAVPYLDARAISDRLDEVVGQCGWRDHYEQWHSFSESTKEKDREITRQVNSQLCTIFIYDEDRKEWIGKTDGAENTDIESVKGGLSDAFKRAAVKWNIGRYLYKFKPVWVKIKAQGKGYVVDPEETTKLESVYDETVKSIFGVSPKEGKKTGAADTKAENEAGKKSVKSTEPVYEITNIRVEEKADTARSSLMLQSGEKKFWAFMEGKDEKLKKGTKITNIKGHVQKNSYGSFTILSSYDIAA